MHILIDLCSYLCNLDVKYMVKTVRLTIINMRSVLEFAMEEPSRNRVVVPARRLHSLTELVPWNRFLGSLKV
jgi:hypothetical protein